MHGKQARLLPDLGGAPAVATDVLNASIFEGQEALIGVYAHVVVEEQLQGGVLPSRGCVVDC